MNRGQMKSADEPVSGGTPRFQKGGFDDAQMEMIMGRLLQVGVLLAATVVLVGGVMYVIKHAGGISDFRVFRPQPFSVRHPMALVRGIAGGQASAVIQLGILLLIATPICRVIFAVIGFVIERDRLYVVVSVVVLAVLLFGMKAAS
jgi:uncharacterized membrane protein